MISKEEKSEIFKTYGTKFGKGDNDTGCAPVQIAIITKRISNLKVHFADHKHDNHSHRGLMKMIGRRRSLLKYVQRKNKENYQSLIKDLGLRK